MGKITVQGYAEQEVSYDLVKIEITFRAKEKTSARAAQEIMNQCESFLKELKRKGINPEEIHLEDDSVRNSYMAREETCITGARKIQLTIPFHMEFMNSVMEQIQTHQGNVDYNTEFCLSDPEAIHEQLLGRAVLDAKKKADAVAAALGQKVIALKTAEPTINGKPERLLDYLKLSCDSVDEYCEEEYISNGLKAPLSKECVYVETVWIIE